ncbi:reverse transcriptase domain-containing protein [Crassaminicella thermophila]|nr:reverse transcriptase domain-containing protein [Crassaminicella thermophila]
MDEKLFQIKYIPKKNAFRKIVTYREDNNIRVMHEKITSFIVKNTLPSKFSKAYIKNRSIVTNAKAHMYNDIFLMMDIQRFFSNINHNKLINVLYYELNKKENIISKVDCTKIVDYCSVGNKGLPIGFVTSPVLSNLYLKEFDNILYGKLKKYNLENVIYTRYADDLTISFKKNSSYANDIIVNIQNTIANLLKRYSLKINERKTKIIDLNKSNHVRITGINIIKDDNNFRRLSVGKKRKNELYWSAINYFLTDKDNRNDAELDKIKGMQSFILSVEKTGYENSFSKAMKSKINELGYNSLKELIDKLE